MTETTFCRICEALCGLEVDVEDGRVTEIRPDARARRDGRVRVRQGPQAAQALRLARSPALPAAPRRSDAWRASRGIAPLAEIGAKVRRLRDEHGPDSIAMYVGTAAGFGVLHPVFAQGFMTGVGSKSMYSSATQDCSNKFAVARAALRLPLHAALSRRRSHPLPRHRGREPGRLQVELPPGARTPSGASRHRGARRARLLRRSAAHRVGEESRASTSSSGPAPTSSSTSPFLHELIAQGGVDRARLDSLHAPASTTPSASSRRGRPSAPPR